MTAERWAHITGVFRAALERSGAERKAFLDEACGSDEPLRRNVERLLAGAEEPSLLSPVPEFLESGALELAPGETLAQYRVEAKIGEGGMGAVYRGFDTRLHRKVALKVLAPERFADPDRKRRLMREARSASALNHPNIVTVYEVGSDRDVDFIAMECVEGKGLDKLIPANGLGAAELLRYAVQMADGLGKAHAAGILHRDLKPSNIMVMEEGRIKILDFGLAKVLQAAAASSGVSDVTGRQLTEEGTVAGTAPYMSPEQADARPLDARSDIFSFGSMLYEMATGRRPFAADTRLALLTKIVNDDPQPPGQLAPLSPELEKLILRCLRKDPSRRYQTMADLKVALEDLETEDFHPRPGRIPIRRVAIWAASFTALAAITYTAIRWLPRSPDAAALRTIKFTITPANLLRGGQGEIDAEVSVSRDGKHIAYVESQGGGQLWIRDIDQEQARPVAGATQVYQAFWSPDNQWIGYSSGRYCGLNGGCDLVRIPVQGGTPAVIVKLPGAFRRACWSSDGQTILYGDTTGLYTVPTRGGSPAQVMEHTHIEHPSYLDLPGGRRAYLYQAVEPGSRGHGIYIRAAGESRSRLITMTSSNNPYPAYSPTGHIVYVDGAEDSPSIWALPFSLSTLEANGKAFPIVQRGSSPVVSLTGTLVYSDVPSNLLQLTWVDRAGKSLSTIGEPHSQASLSLSPDGRRLAVEERGNGFDMWVYDLARGVKTRFTSDPTIETLAAWTPAGDEITYGSVRDGNVDIVSKRSSGSGEAKLLVSTPLTEAAPDWSPDARFLIYMAGSREIKSHLLYRERHGDGSLGEPVVFVKSDFNARDPRFSPDGRFVAYVSDESGRNEVYVRDFPKGAARWQISGNGGTGPRWKRDGGEIFYVEGRKLMSVGVSTRPGFVPGAPVTLFERRMFQATGYDAAPDGKRFILLDRLEGEPPLSIHVVHNWFEEFRGQLGAARPN
jgi:serine/threonine protein kinase/Tol biopolymer transport system component